MSDPRPTNVLLVFTDQMRGQAMGCAGNAQLPTPNLDRLASEGTRFTNCYCNSPVCTPSRGSLLTGLYPQHHGAVVNDIAIRTDVPSLGTIFRDAGYATGYVGKWHLDGVPRDKFTPPGPRRLGFDTFWAVHNCTHAYNDTFHYRDSDERIPSGDYEPECQTRLAIDFLRRHRADPFCLTLSWGTPHDPYQEMPQRYRQRFDPAEIHLRPNVPDEVAEASRGDIAGYYGHIVAIDEYVGQLMTALEDLGLADNTLVVFTSDHGDMLGSQGQVRKQRPWEESISIPLMIRQPGRVGAGRVSDAMVGVVDLLPTMLGLVDLGGGEAMQGCDLSDVITGAGRGDGSVVLANPIPTGNFRRSQAEVLVTNPFPVDDYRDMVEWWGLRTPRYTYARTLDKSWVLYDNERDPFQLENLAGQAESVDLEHQLDTRLRQRLDEIGEPMQPWSEMIRSMNLVDQWNAREHELHGRNPEIMRPLSPDGR